MVHEQDVCRMPLFAVCFFYWHTTNAAFTACLYFVMCFLVYTRQNRLLQCARYKAHGKLSGTRQKLGFGSEWFPKFAMRFTYLHDINRKQRAYEREILNGHKTMLLKDNKHKILFMASIIIL